MGDQGITTRSNWLRFISVVTLIAVLVGGLLIATQVRSSRAAAGQVAWIDEPANASFLKSSLPRPLPMPPPQLGSPACTAGQLSVANVRPLGITQDDGISIPLRNNGSAACLLKGTPQVVATSPGKPNVLAAPTPMPSFGEVTDTAPGKIVSLWIDAPVSCLAYPGGAPFTSPGYQSLTISMPSGGSIVVNDLHLPVACGIFSTPFFTMKPQPTYPKNPLVALVPRLQVPATVLAGTTLSYVVDLTNPTNRKISLSPCPGYLENSTIPTKFVYRLNCQSVRSIPPRSHIAYQMKMSIPKTAPSGTTRVGWFLFGASTVFGHARLKVIH